MWWREHYCRDDWLRVGRVMSILEHNFVSSMARAKMAMRSKAAVNDMHFSVFKEISGAEQG